MGLKNLPICKHVYIYTSFFQKPLPINMKKQHVLELWLLLNKQFLCRVHKMYRNNNQIQMATPYNRVIETLVTTSSDRGSRWLRGGTERNLQETVCSIELFYHNKKLAQRLDDLKRKKDSAIHQCQHSETVCSAKGIVSRSLYKSKETQTMTKVNSVMMRLEFATRDFQHVLLSHFIDQNLRKYRCPELVDLGSFDLKDFKVEFCRHDRGNIDKNKVNIRLYIYIFQMTIP